MRDDAGSWEEEVNADKRGVRGRRKSREKKLQSLPSDKHRMDCKIFSDVARLSAHGAAGD